jgi:hypothetical protein
MVTVFAITIASPAINPVVTIEQKRAAACIYRPALEDTGIKGTTGNAGAYHALSSAPRCTAHDAKLTQRADCKNNWRLLDPRLPRLDLMSFIWSIIRHNHDDDVVNVRGYGGWKQKLRAAKS